MRLIFVVCLTLQVFHKKKSSQARTTGRTLATSNATPPLVMFCCSYCCNKITLSSVDACDIEGVDQLAGMYTIICMLYVYKIFCRSSKLPKKQLRCRQ